MRPTTRFLLLALIGFLACVPAIYLGPAWWLAWPIYMGMLVAALLADFLLSAKARQFSIHSTLTQMGYVGANVVPTLQVRSGPVAPHQLVLTLNAPSELIGQRWRALEGHANTSYEVPFSLRATRRGKFDMGTCLMQWQGPLGLLTHNLDVAINSSVTVSPNIDKVKQAALRVAQDSNYIGQRVNRFIGDGSEFEQLREYQAGLDHRAMDWKSSARHRKLFSRQFQAERNHQIIVGVDCGRIMNEVAGGATKLDHAIHEALWLSWVGLQAGDKVGFAGFGEQLAAWVPPQNGRDAFSAISASAAAIAYKAAETNFALCMTELMSRLQRRALVVIYTDLVDSVMAELLTDNLSRLAQRHAVILAVTQDEALRANTTAMPKSFGDVASAVVAAELQRERARVFERLRGAGVHWIEVPVGQMSISVIDKYLELKRREVF